MKKFVRILSMVMAMAMLFSLTACSQQNIEPSEEVPVVTEDISAVDIESIATVENPVTFFSMTMGEDFNDISSMNAFANEDGTIYVEYISDVKKVGNMDPKVLHGITAELEKTELVTLNGADNYAEGEANASMYIEFTDGTSLTVNYTGEISEMFVNGYTAMDNYFKRLTADLEIYVPQPQVMGEINEEMLKEAMDILNGSEMPNADNIIISGLDVNEEFFAMIAGLSNNDGIVNAVSIAPMMMSQAYSLVIVELDDVANAEAVGTDFEENIDWMKWVCVAPSNTLIATKDNMVLCLQAADDMYTMTVNGIEAAGWTQVNVMDNPNM